MGSYSNACGTGNRGLLISATVSAATMFSGSVAELVNGNTAASSLWFNSAAAAGKWIEFTFLSPVIITEAKWYQDIATAHGSWKWQGSNNDSDWTDIGSAFTLGGATTQTQTELAGNGTRYLYYRLLGVSGNTSSASYLLEVEFKIESSDAASPSYYNLGGYGDRVSVSASSAVLVTATPSLTGGLSQAHGLLDGSSADVFFFVNGLSADVHRLVFGFGSGKVITEARWVQTTTDSHGVWQWRGSNNGIDWTNIGSTFTLGGATTQTQTGLNGNVEAYRLYALWGVSGTTSSGPWLTELLFEILDVAADAGVADYPSQDDVRQSIVYGNGLYTGTLVAGSSGASYLAA